MTIQEEYFPGTAFAGCTGYPFPTLSFRAQREIFFVTPFASSFAKPFIGSTAHRLSAIRCFPFLAVGRAPSYHQRKRSLGFARDDDTGRTHFPHTLCMIQRISIPYTVISSAARNLPCTPSFLTPFAKGFPFSAVSHRALYQCAGKIEGFARDDVAEVAFSQHIRCTLREINPFPHTVMRGAARNLPCTLLFLAPFAEGFQFYFVTHTTLYRCARKIPRLRSG